MRTDTTEQDAQHRRALTGGGAHTLRRPAADTRTRIRNSLGRRPLPTLWPICPSAPHRAHLWGARSCTRPLPQDAQLQRVLAKLSSQPHLYSLLQKRVMFISDSLSKHRKEASSESHPAIRGATFDLFPFLFLARPWRFLDLVPEPLLFTDDLDWVFLLPDAFFRLPTKRTLRVCALLRALRPPPHPTPPHASPSTDVPCTARTRHADNYT